MLEIIHVHCTGDVPEALTVNGIFQQGCACGHAHWSKKSPDSHGLHNAFHKQNFLLRAFPPAVLKFPMFGPGKKQNCFKYSSTERIAQIHHQEEKQDYDFTVFVLIPDLLQHMIFPPSLVSSLIFDSSIQKILTEVRFMQMEDLSSRKPCQCLESAGTPGDGGFIN